MTKRHLTASALLAATLVLSACGGGEDDTATTGSAAGTTSSTPGTTAVQANDADERFLAGMKPHHEQAVEMSDIVLAADPPAEVAAIARQIKAAQAPEIEQMDMMMGDLGSMAEDMSPGMDHGGSTGTTHGGMMDGKDMSALMAATGDDAARLYLEGMIEHHKGAIEASNAELEDGVYEPARTLATSIAEDQAAEITKLESLLAAL